jgi:Rps23 Pro-64 3,4-dihydroxylase Tpa1-like proline 4-hydroxylase
MQGIINDIDSEKYQNQFKNADPYPYVIIDNFFTNSFLKEVQENFPRYEDSNWFRFRKNIGEYENIFESGMNAISKPENMPNLCRSFLHNLNSFEFCKVLERITGITGIEPDPHWHYTGLRVNTSGAHQLIHSDALFHPHLKKRKILTCMTYMTEGWKKEDEGCLEIWDNDMKNCVRKIEPIFNRVVIFQNTDTSYHGVTRNNHYRQAITMSYLLNEKEEKRWRALFVKRPEDDKVKNFDIIANHRAKLNDTK